MLTLYPEAVLQNVDMWGRAEVIWNWAFYVSQGIMMSTVKAKLFWGLEFWAGICQKIVQKMLYAKKSPTLGILSLANCPYPEEVTSHKSQSTNYSNTYAASC